MNNKRWYEWLLAIAFAAMIVVCLYLNLFTGQAETLANIIVNVVMFVIVGLVFLNCDIGSFSPTNKIIDDLERATEKIRSDAMNSHQYLYKEYRSGKVDLFRTPTLKRLMTDYNREFDRIERSDKVYYRCDIEDYINYDLTDATIHRNMLNQVSGAMTGLGILGTFIGLSLGLQGFNTGTTEEITNSIAPLMGGIKVAFHTSIYGLIFSLVFNYVFKRKLDEAETAVHAFLDAFKKYVVPDMTAQGINRLIDLQLQQADTLNAISESMGERMYDNLTGMMNMQIGQLDRTLSDFCNATTKNQMDALSDVVRNFIVEMNKSVDGSFTQLAHTVEQAYLSQRENSRQMTEILQHTGSTAENLREIDERTASVVKKLENYNENVDNIQRRIEKSIDKLAKLNEKNIEEID